MENQPRLKKFRINLGFWGNCSPTPSLSQQFALSGTTVSDNVDLGEGWVFSFPET